MRDLGTLSGYPKKDILQPVSIRRGYRWLCAGIIGKGKYTALLWQDGIMKELETLLPSNLVRKAWAPPRHQ